MPCAILQRTPALANGARKCACGGNPGPSGECEECRKKRLGIVQRSANGTASSSFAPPTVHDVLQSPGHSIDQVTRISMETYFGHDFSRVKVHSDAQAAASARAVNALAYTVGNNLVFGSGQYAPVTIQGQRLLAHELTHVIQQESTGGSLQAAGLNIMGNDRYEHEAEAAANGIATGQQVHIPGGNAQGIQRWPWPGGAKTQENNCSGYEQDPQSLSIETAKHFLDDVQPGTGSRLVKTTECKANENRPERIECIVTFGDGQVIQVSIETQLHNVEGQRKTADGREWCVYHFTCDSNGTLVFQKKGCSADFKAKPSTPTGPDLVGSRTDAPTGGKSKTV
jgi:hypothetical protein